MPVEFRRWLSHVLFFLFFFVLRKIAVLAHLFSLFFFLFFFVFIQIFGDDVQMNRVYLRYLELGFTFRATEDLALLDFVFVDVDFGGTFWAADHGSILRSIVHKGSVARTSSTTVQRIIYRRCEVNSHGRECCSVGNGSRDSGGEKWHLRANIRNARWSASAG